MVVKKSAPKNVEDVREHFKNLIDSFEETHGYPFGAKECLRCIEIAKAQMESGKYSVESFLKAKELLINSVKCTGTLN